MLVDVEHHWWFNGAFEFVRIVELAATDPQKFYLSVARRFRSDSACFVLEYTSILATGKSYQKGE